jgi:glycine betaine/proline transport system ATP-binding protein
MDTAVRGDEADCRCETATPDTPFVELCAISASIAHPVAVLDAERGLVGVVPRQRLVGFLGDRPDEPTPCDSPGDTDDQDGKVIVRA